MTAPCRNRSAGTRQNVVRFRGIGPEHVREFGKTMRSVWHEAASVSEDDMGSRIPSTTPFSTSCTAVRVVSNG